METSLELEKKIFQSICKKKEWIAVCGKVNVGLDEFYQICDLMVDFDLFNLLDFFIENNYMLIEEDVEEIRNLSALELIPETLLEKLKRK